MTDYQVIDRINELLDSTDDQTVNTSMRIPAALRDAAALTVNELDLAPSTTVLTANALRAALEAAVMQAVLDRHYEEHPDAGPTLADLAIAAAELEDVLLWAEARTSAAA